MKIITLTNEQFTEFAKNHKYRSYYQTINYARLMKLDGYDYHLLGFLNNSNELIGASMVLYKKIFLNYKMAYAPFGFLIDYSNNDLVEELTERLKRLLLKQKFIYLKINPRIECSRRNQDGEIIAYNPEINDIMEILQRNNYVHYGFNNYFETDKPRWNAILKLTSANDKLYTNLSKQVRNKINKAKKCGIEVKEATKPEDIEILYEFIKRKHNRDLKYYQQLLKEFYGSAKIYFSVLNTEKFLKQSKDNYEFELNKNELLNYKLQNADKNSPSYERIISQKMESDKLTANGSKNLQEATRLFSKYPNNIIVGGILTISYEDEENLIIEGFNNKYRDYDPNYLLKWELIEKFNKEGKTVFNLNGIVGEFKESNKYSGLNELKLGYNADAVEYIGEFNLIINKTIYNIYKHSLERKHKKDIKKKNKLDKK